LNYLRTIQRKVKQKYGAIIKQFLEDGMKNFAFKNRVLQIDRVPERRVLEKECTVYLQQQIVTGGNLPSLIFCPSDGKGEFAFIFNFS
jgi:hypothetical protein